MVVKRSTYDDYQLDALQLNLALIILNYRAIRRLRTKKYSTVDRYSVTNYGTYLEPAF
jgi:hypothetical protein